MKAVEALGDMVGVVKAGHWGRSLKVVRSPGSGPDLSAFWSIITRC